MRRSCQYERVGAGTIRCVQCGRRREWTRADLPRRNCDGMLSPWGQRLAAMAPGDGLAWLARYTGLAALARLILGEECRRCRDRQRKINARWIRTVYRLDR
jgi:hypothetical protein